MRLIDADEAIEYLKNKIEINRYYGTTARTAEQKWRRLFDETN